MRATVEYAKGLGDATAPLSVVKVSFYNRWRSTKLSMLPNPALLSWRVWIGKTPCCHWTACMLSSGDLGGIGVLILIRAAVQWRFFCFMSSCLEEYHK